MKKFLILFALSVSPALSSAAGAVVPPPKPPKHVAPGGIGSGKGLQNGFWRGNSTGQATRVRAFPPQFMPFEECDMECVTTAEKTFTLPTFQFMMRTAEKEGNLIRVDDFVDNMAKAKVMAEIEALVSPREATRLLSGVANAKYTAEREGWDAEAKKKVEELERDVYKNGITWSNVRQLRQVSDNCPAESQGMIGVGI